MTEHAQWCVVSKDEPVHVYARFVNETAARNAVLHMNWMPDRASVRVIRMDPPNQGQLL